MSKDFYPEINETLDGNLTIDGNLTTDGNLTEDGSSTVDETEGISEESEDPFGDALIGDESDDTTTGNVTESFFEGVEGNGSGNDTSNETDAQEEPELNYYAFWTAEFATAATVT